MKCGMLVVIVAVLACTKAKTNELPAEAWGVDDYAKAGLRIDKPWTPDDYTNAATILQQQTAGHRERLPRFHGAKSGEVFAKLIADLPDDSSAPIRDRFIAHEVHGEAANAISKLYMENQLATPTREWIELFAVSLREGTAMASMTDEFLASFGPDDPKHEARLRGIAQMRAGFGMMMFGSLLVADNLRVPEADRVAVLTHLTAALPTLFPFAPPERQTAIRELIGKQVAAFPPGKLHDAIVAAQQALPKS